MPKPLVVLGSARSNGETRRAVDLAFLAHAVDIVDLKDCALNGYDYAHGNANDDFLSIAKRMTVADAIIFATPVYWYAMSAPLKIFFDRLTDLFETEKSAGRALAGKDVWLLATGTENELPAGFETPFSRTADYFEMHYCGAGYLYTGNDMKSREMSEAAIASFGQRILFGPMPRSRDSL